MSSEDTLPRIESCIVLYLDAWTLFGEQLFTSAELSRRIVEEDRDTSTITGTNEPTNHLELLVAYGLLGHNGEERYRIHCTPTESVEKWQQKSHSQLETVREQVIDRYEQRISESESGSGRTDLLQCDGATYVRVAVETDTPAGMIEDATERSTDSPNIAGIVLCCPAAQAGHAQQLADSLYNGTTTTEADIERFEKVTSEVIGERKDDLEYRLYLRELA
jgi:hypothetical protein